MACLVLGKEIGANTDVCVFALLFGAVFMLTFASLCATKPRTSARADNLQAYQAKENKDNGLRTRFR